MMITLVDPATKTYTCSGPTTLSQAQKLVDSGQITEINLDRSEIYLKDGWKIAASLNNCRYVLELLQEKSMTQVYEKSSWSPPAPFDMEGWRNAFDQGWITGILEKRSYAGSHRYFDNVVTTNYYAVLGEREIEVCKSMFDQISKWFSENKIQFSKLHRGDWFRFNSSGPKLQKVDAVYAWHTQTLQVIKLDSPDTMVFKSTINGDK